MTSDVGYVLSQDYDFSWKNIDKPDFELEGENIAEKSWYNMINSAKASKWNSGLSPSASYRDKTDYKDRATKVSKLTINNEDSEIKKSFVTEKDFKKCFN